MVLSLPINVNKRLTPELCSFLLKELVKSLLYLRNQIPHPLDNLEEAFVKEHKKPEAGENKRRKLVGGVSKKAAVFLEQLSRAFHDIDTLLANEAATEYAIVFGPSYSSPKETYVVRFHDVFGNGSKMGIGTKPNELYRRLFGGLMKSLSSTIFARDLQPTRLFIAVLLRGEKTVPFPVMECPGIDDRAGSEGASAPLSLDAFIPCRGFVLKQYHRMRRPTRPSARVNRDGRQGVSLAAASSPSHSVSTGHTGRQEGRNASPAVVVKESPFVVIDILSGRAAMPSFHLANPAAASCGSREEGILAFGLEEQRRRGPWRDLNLLVHDEMRGAGGREDGSCAKRSSSEEEASDVHPGNSEVEELRPEDACSGMSSGFWIVSSRAKLRGFVLGLKDTGAPLH